MPGAELAQYGIGFFAVAGLIYIMGKFLDKKNNNEIASVIKNNTKALEQVVSVIQAVQINMARQEQKIDELLERARR